MVVEYQQTLCSIYLLFNDCWNMKWGYNFVLLVFSLIFSYIACSLWSKLKPFFCNVVSTSFAPTKNISTQVIIHPSGYRYYSLTLIIRAFDLSSKLAKFVDILTSNRSELTIYLLLSTGSFSSTSDFPELTSSFNARVTRCDPLLCDNIVYSVFAYEVSDLGGILLWNESLPLEQVISVVKSPFPSFVSDWFSVYSLHEVRQIISDSRFETIYNSFNPIKRIEQFKTIADNKLNKSIDWEESTKFNNTLESSNPSKSILPVNNSIAVVMNVFKRNYFDHVFSALCTQSLPPSLVVLVQNEAHLLNIHSLIPPVCQHTNTLFFHIWNSNWNPYSFFRHFVPIPSEIRYTVITDDDLFLQPKALEMGVKVVETYHCVATEHGGKIINSTEGFDAWEDVRSSNSSIRFADYASLPQFSKTSWRKKVMKTPPFYRRFGDILFASISLFQEANIPPCIPPNFTFCEESKDDDSFSTLKKNRGLYADDYNRIALTWMKRGYIPLYQRERV